MSSRWITPFLKQSFLMAGLSLIIMQTGLSAAYVVGLSLQLKDPNSEIPMSVEASSWFASLNGLSYLGCNVIAAIVMDKYGRWISILCAAGFMFAGWIFIVTAHSIAALMMGRLLQGIGTAFISTVGGITAGECTSPKYRGFFCAATNFLLTIGVALTHYIGSFLHWRTTSLFCLVISFINLLISIYSPESPYWLASKSRYGECRKVFRWLRGSDEEEELQKMILTYSDVEKSKHKAKKTFTVQEMKNIMSYIITMIRKKEVYKSILVGIHIAMLYNWSGFAIFNSYPNDAIRLVIGAEVNMPFILLWLDVQKIIASTSAMYIVQKFKRKTMLFTTVGLNSAIYLVIAGYTYAKEQKLLPYDNPAIGIVLIHIHMFSMAIGIAPLTFVLLGEIYPSEHRSVTAPVVHTIGSISFFLPYKTFPQTIRIGLSGAYVIYGTILFYSLSLCYYILPETKDKTIQEIEDEYRGTTNRSSEGTQSRWSRLSLYGSRQAMSDAFGQLEKSDTSVGHLHTRKRKKTNRSETSPILIPLKEQEEMYKR